MMRLAPLALLIIAAAPAAAEPPPCDWRPVVLEHLARRYSERPVGAGFTQDGTVLEVLSSPNGSTWSLIETTRSGWSCLIGSGEGWAAIPQLKGDPT